MCYWRDSIVVPAGKRYAAGPVSLLSGLNPDPSALVTYFFMIAVFGMGRLPYRKGLRGIWLALMVLVVACKIIFPIIRAEGVRCVIMPSGLVHGSMTTRHSTHSQTMQWVKYKCMAQVEHLSECARACRAVFFPSTASKPYLERLKKLERNGSYSPRSVHGSVKVNADTNGKANGKLH